MTPISKAISGLLLAGLVASAALQLGQAPVAAVLFGSVAGLAGLFLLERHLLQSSTGRMLFWMTVLATHGWLLGLRYDFGPYGLMIFGSWCSTGAPGELPVVLLAKASLAPHAHLFMLLFGIAGTMIGSRNAEKPLLGCCAMALFAMPLALVAADSALLLVRDQLWIETGLLMSLLMIGAMLLSGWAVTVLLSPRWGRRVAAALSASSAPQSA